MSTTQGTETTNNTTNIVLGDFGSGRFSPAMKELYKDCQRLLGFSEREAHVTARQLGVDAGQLSKGQVSLKYGKSVNKEGFMTLKEVTESIKIQASPAMNIASVCSQLDGARKIGLVVTECTMSPVIMEWVADKASKLVVSE